MSEVNSNFDDELLSAYVDGELTVDERALVEERLRTDPQAAQLVEELRSLSSAVKSLPRETLGRDLRTSIWNDIDHAHEDDKARHVISLSEPLDPPRGFRRGFVWSTIAIAAALMVMFLQEQQEQRGDRDVAAVEKKDAEQAAADRDESRLALEDRELPDLGEMRSRKSAQEESLPAAPAPAESAAAEPDAVADAAPTDDSELERLGNEPAAAERQLAQTTGQPAQMEAALAESEVGQADALGVAAAPTAAMPIGPPEPLATVELAVKADDGLTRFKRHLAENNFTTPTPTDGADKRFRRALGREPEAAGEPASADGAVEAESSYAIGGKLKSELDSGPVEVLVEGSPQQIESLVASFQTDRDYFAEVNAPESLMRNEAFSYGATPTGGAAAGAAVTQLDAAGGIEARGGGLAAQPQSRAAGPREVADQPAEATGRAWILSYGWFDSGGRQEADKAKESLAESAVELGAATEGKADLARRSASLEFRHETETLAKQSETLAKQLSQPPEAGRVRVRFVLRAAEPQPAAAPAEPKP